MPLFDCGYFMEQDKVRAFVPKFLNEEGDDLQCLLRDIIYWWFYLLPEVRARTALPNIYLPPGCESFRAGYIWIPSRSCVQSDEPNGPIEIDADKIVKTQFLEATKGGLDEKEMTYFTKQIRVVRG